MKDYENLAAILILGVIAAMAVFFKVLEGPAKDVALTVVSGLIGFIGRGAYQTATDIKYGPGNKVIVNDTPLDVIK